MAPVVPTATHCERRDDRTTIPTGTGLGMRTADATPRPVHRVDGPHRARYTSTTDTTDTSHSAKRSGIPYARFLVWQIVPPIREATTQDLNRGAGVI